MFLLSEDSRSECELHEPGNEELLSSTITFLQIRELYDEVLDLEKEGPEQILFYGKLMEMMANFLSLNKFPLS